MKRFSQPLFSSDFYPLLLLFGLWLAMQIFLLSHFGVETGFEAAKYIEQANYFLQTGHYTTGNFLFYSTQILLIAFAVKFQTGFFFVVLVQWILNAVSLLLFYQLVRRHTKSRKVAFAFSLLLLAMIYYQLYNVYLFTESIFFSLSIAFVFFLFTCRRLSVPNVLATLFFLVVLIFTRPTGLLFFPGTVVYFILKFGGAKKRMFSLVSVVFGLAGFYFLLNTALGSGGELDFLLPYAQEHVICGVATIQQENNLQLPANQNSVEGLFFILKNHTGLFVKLAAKRAVAFWGVRRPFYSGLHNAFVSVYFYSLYGLIIAGVRKRLKFYFPETIFLLFYILLVCLTVLLSCDEWHNRFLFSLLPFLLLLAAGPFTQKKTQEENGNNG